LRRIPCVSLFAYNIEILIKVITSILVVILSYGFHLTLPPLPWKCLYSYFRSILVKRAMIGGVPQVAKTNETAYF
jgi:hypothetical protein